MNDDIKKLAAELVKSPHWQWMRGMSVRTTRTAGFPPTPAGTSVVLESAEDLDDHIVEGRFGAIAPEPHHSDPDFGAKSDLHDASVERARATAIPDLDDPLTAAGLLLVAREAWADPNLYCCNLDGYDGCGWTTIIDRSDHPNSRHGVLWICGLTETEALARAILAAPTVTNKETP